MAEYQVTAPSDSSVNMYDVENEIFTDVAGKERHGRVRGVGMGPTPSTYYGASAQRYSCSQTRSTQEVQTLRHEMRTMQEHFEEAEAARQAQIARLEEARDKERRRYEQLQSKFDLLMDLMQQKFS